MVVSFPPLRMATIAHRLRFADFEADLRTGELHRGGERVRLPDQSFRILGMLLERPGELVTREELRQKLWAADTFVDFDVGLNSAIRRLRDALGDSADQPRFVETLPRRGYRFIAELAPVTNHQPIAAVPTEITPSAANAEATGTPKPHRRQPAMFWMAVTVAVLAAVVGVILWQRHNSVLPSSTRFTRIVVLPLDNHTGDASQQYLADGITDALITDLTEIRALHVSSRMSSSRFRGSQKTLQEITKELQVDVVLGGSVSRAGDRVRVDAQLMSSSGENLWAQAYETDVKDILKTQSDIAIAIARQMQIDITAEERNRLTSLRPVNPEAYELYVRGRFLWNKRNPDALRKSVDYFEAAIQKDPNYAAAYAGLADAYNTMAGGVNRLLPPAEAMPKAKAAAERAIALDDNLAEAHRALAFVKTRYDWDFAGAEKEFRRAISLDPGDPEAYMQLGLLVYHMGRQEESCAAIQQAYRLDHLSPNIGRYWMFCLAEQGKDREADAELVRLLDLDPKRLNVELSAAYMHNMRGQVQEAVADLERAAAENPGIIHVQLLLANAYLRAGKVHEAQRILGSALPQAERSGVESFYLAMVYTNMGRKDDAFHWLDVAYKQRDVELLRLVSDVNFEPLRTDPRFANLVNRMGLPIFAVLGRPAAAPP